MLIHPTHIESLDVRKMIRLNLLFFFPAQFRRGIKKRDYFVSEVSIGLIVLPLNDAELKLNDSFEDPRYTRCQMFQNSHSILKENVFWIITHLTISAESEEIRKLKISFKIG